MHFNDAFSAIRRQLQRRWVWRLRVSNLLSQSRSYLVRSRFVKSLLVQVDERIFKIALVTDVVDWPPPPGEPSAWNQTAIWISNQPLNKLSAPKKCLINKWNKQHWNHKERLGELRFYAISRGLVSCCIRNLQPRHGKMSEKVLSLHAHAKRFSMFSSSECGSESSPSWWKRI